MIHRTVANAIKKVAKGISNEERLEYVCPGVFEKVCETNGWEFIMDTDTNGWQVDWWAIIKVDCLEIKVSGCMYYGTAELSNGKYL